ncbi:hypothetical protein F4560_003306 [Saccharothrix ecbatanensis]|uniref:Uncharacterized protein n=1 Tax=Saccharothrix ecbatanensis TaxID=1105145 RepID=A0A7W9HJP0_9PSEU|nr:hypothetical protein [Saccharothrix ecbatanensis]
MDSVLAAIVLVPLTEDSGSVHNYRSCRLHPYRNVVPVLSPRAAAAVVIDKVEPYGTYQPRHTDSGPGTVAWPRTLVRNSGSSPGQRGPELNHRPVVGDFTAHAE